MWSMRMVRIIFGMSFFLAGSFLLACELNFFSNWGSLYDVRSFAERKLASVDLQSAVEPSCEEAKKVAFLKMHKCASTTLQNIFLRYAHLNDLNVVLPPDRWNYLGSPDKFTLKIVEKTLWHNLGYDIMTLHTRWNHQAVEEALGIGAKFVTIVRNPVEHFESMYGYYGLYGFFGNLTIGDFIKKLDDPDFKKKNDRYLYKIGRNQMMFDLGFGVENFDDDQKIDEFLDEVERNFHLVMVTDLFEESIVLLKHLLCWEYKDVAYVRLNARPQSKKKTFNETEIARIKKWLKADVALYERMTKMFEEKVKEFGSTRMNEEKQKLKIINEKVVAECSNTPNETVSYDKLINQMRKKPGCRVYAMPEYDFLDEIKAAQLKRADKAALLAHDLR